MESKKTPVHKERPEHGKRPSPIIHGNSKKKAKSKKIAAAAKAAYHGIQKSATGAVNTANFRLAAPRKIHTNNSPVSFLSSSDSNLQSGQNHFFPNMPVQRVNQMNFDNHDDFTSDSYGNFGHRQRSRWDQFTDFSQDWPNPWDARPNYNNWWHHQQSHWQQRGGGNWFADGPGGRGFDRYRTGPGPGGGWGPAPVDTHNWQQPDPPSRSHIVGNHKAGPHGDQVQRNPQDREDGGGGNQWQNLTRQFDHHHFHRENANSTEGSLSSSGGSLGSRQADTSNLGDAGSSGSSRKRPRSLDRAGQLSKSSRADNSKTRSNPLHSGSVRASSLDDLSGGGVEMPASVSGQRKSQGAVGKGANSMAGPGSKPGGVGGKKKQATDKHKSSTTGPGPRAVDKGTKASEPRRETSGEGVLERAERMCQELREKRQQAGHVRSNSNAVRVAELRGALNTSVRRFNSAHKSFLRGYMSDSSTANAVNAGGSSTVPATQKKQFSSSTSSEPQRTARPISSPAVGSSVSTAASSSVTSSMSRVNDIDRIRHTIESSVMADGRGSKRSGREKSSSGNSSLTTSVSSSATHTATAAEVTSSSAVSKPPLPLSKDALAKMVKTPQSRSQRLQLARILRQHTVPASTRPRRITLAGLYNNNDGGDSIGDVLKDISGVEVIGECSELENIKLEDLTNEDKLRIAQLIEDVDVTDKDPESASSEVRDEVTVPRRSRVTRISLSESSDKDVEIVSLTEHSRLAHRRQAASPSPSGPLSLDDLNTESRSRQSPSPVTFIEPRPLSAGPTAVRAKSPARHTSLQPSSAPRPAAVRSLSPARSTGAAKDRGGKANISGGDLPLLDSTIHEQSGRMSPDHGSRSSPQIPMEVSDATGEDTPVTTADYQFSREGGVLHEVLGLCQRQDAVVGEMRDIDVELSQMYKSLIEIVARMSGLQRRRVQLQSEGEQLSQQRNHLLTGLLPHTSVALNGGPHSAGRGSRHSSSDTGAVPPGQFTSAAEDSRANSTTPSGDHLVRPSVGSSVILPSWLSAPASSSQTTAVSGGVSQAAGRTGTGTETGTRTGTGAGTTLSADATGDVCLSGSVTSSVGSSTPRAASQDTTLDHSVDSVRDERQAQDRAVRLTGSGRSSRPASAGSGDRAGRVMLSIDGGVGASGDREASSSSMSSVSAKAAMKSSVGADSSSGVGSSVSTLVSTAQTSSGVPVSDPNLHVDQSLAAGSEPEHTGKPPQCPEPSSDMNPLFASPSHSGGGSQNSNPSQPNSPAVSVAYLGALSSDLVQQIVRNLPLTSQLGEMGSPAMYMLKTAVGGDTSGSHLPGGAAAARSRSSSVDMSTAKPRPRTTSLHSISSDLSAGELSLPSSVPPLKLCDGADKGESKTCTPRSESDAPSVTSGASLGEQIKLLSERNSSSQGTASNLSSLSYIANNGEEDFASGGGGGGGGASLTDMANCSVVLDKLDLENITVVPWKLEEEEVDRPKRRKTKKDRDQSLQRRRRFVATSSSEGEEEGDEEEEGRGDVSVADSVSQSSQYGSTACPGGVELMEGDSGPEGQGLDSTLVDSMSQEEEGCSSQLSTQRDATSSRLRLDPENLKAFRANVRLSLASTAATRDSDVEIVTGADSKDSSVTKKDSVKMIGPCAPVMGITVHNNMLFVGFQGIGVHSYTLGGEPSGAYWVDTAQCFTLAPVGSGSQHHLVVGCQDHLSFLSTGDQAVISSVDTVVKVMCLLVVDASLFAGLDSGAVVVVSLTTLEETRRFQASDCALHCMAWTREGITRLLAVSSQDASIHVMDAASGLPIRIISSHSKTAFTLYMLDHFVLSGSGDRKVMAHNVHTAGLAWELHDHKGIVTSVCVDSGLLFTAGYDKIIRCYDLKSRKLLYLLYGAGKSIIMKMAVHNSILYTGNRDGQVEGVDLRDLGSFACECVSCTGVYGLKEHLWHHLVADHLLPNSQAMRCPWTDCLTMLNTGSALVKAGEHMRQHIDGSQSLQSSETNLEDYTLPDLN